MEGELRALRVGLGIGSSKPAPSKNEGAAPAVHGGKTVRFRGVVRASWGGAVLSSYRVALCAWKENGAAFLRRTLIGGDAS